MTPPPDWTVEEEKAFHAHWKAEIEREQQRWEKLSNPDS